MIEHQVEEGDIEEGKKNQRVKEQRRNQGIQIKTKQK